MKPKYLNNLIEKSYSLFTRMKSGIRKAGLVALVGLIIRLAGPSISADGSTLYFRSNRSGGSGNLDIRQVSIEPVVDFNADGIVDFKDFSKLAQYWLQNERSVDIAPPTGNGIVDIQDFAVLAEHWLEDYRLIKETKIAFVSNRDGFSNHEIYAMNADGTEQKNLTDNPALDVGDYDMVPSWSPDGKKIAFFARRELSADIYVMNADGSEQKRLTDNPTDGESPFWLPNDWHPSWSPDGTKIAFGSDRYDGNWDINLDINYDIYVMNADGSEQKRLTNNPTDDDYPSWSPDGRKIAFESDGDGNVEIYVVNADGSEQRNLTNNPATDLFPFWSPDGKKIAFDSDRDGNSEVYVMNADGSEQKRLTNNPAGDYVSFWSPDGKKIAFISHRDGNGEIYVMSADGTGQRNLTNNPADDYTPSWSPDGKKIAFGSYRRDWNEEIYVMNADGSEQKNLTNNPASDENPSWSPFLPLENKTKDKK